MDDRLSQLETRLREVDEAVGLLCRRVAVLEQSAAPSRDAAGPVVEDAMPPAPPASVVPVPIAPWGDPARLLSLVGRTFVILGGAFLLRAVTESGRLPQASGIVLGFAYASVWIGAADRVGVRRPTSGLFHGLAGVIIGVAILWEASTRFDFLRPTTSAVVLALLVLGALGVAWHRRLEWLALIVTVAGVATNLVLALASGHAQPYAVCGVAIGVATAWLGVDQRWTLPRWPAAIAANLLVIALISRAVAPMSLEPPSAALVTALLLAGAYLAVVIVPGIAHRRDPDIFEVLQSAVGLSIGFAGAFNLAGLAGAGTPSVIGASLAVVGTSGYLLVHVRAAHVTPGMSAYLTTVALALALWGGSTWFSGTPRTAWLAVVALILSWPSVALDRASVTVHAVIVGLAAALSSGLLAYTAEVWVGSPERAALRAPALVALAVLAFGLLAGRRQADRRVPAAESLARLTRGLVFVAGAGALVVAMMARWIAAPPDTAAFSSIRSVTLAASAVLLAAAARTAFGRELSWLAYPVLAVAGVKLIAEDLRVSSPAMLFLVLAVYGLSLILTAKLFGQRRPQPVVPS
jgi:hypothetical protein